MFALGDEIDQQLCITISHQFLRAESAFARFLQCRSGKNIDIYKKNDPIERIFNSERQIQVDTYNAYVDFIHHLYEYIIACFKRDQKSLKNIDYKITDKRINREANKYRKQCITLIDNGLSEQYGLNSKEYYLDEVPCTFGTEFRKARNINVHADIRRVKTGFMTDFYKKYHKFVLFIFFFGYGYWSNPNPENIDWKDITEFAKIIDN